MWNPYNIIAEPTTNVEIDFEFQIIEVEVCDHLPAEISNYDVYSMKSNSFIDSLPYEEKDYSRPCTVLLYGVTAAGENVLLRVDGFRPSIAYESSGYMLRSKILNRIAEHTQLDVDELKSHSRSKTCRRLYGWVPDDLNPTDAKLFDYLVVTFPNIRTFRKASSFAIDGIRPHETKVDPIMQFMDLTSLIPCGWVKCKTSEACSKISHLQIERRCNITSLEPVEKNEAAPLVIAAFDIECNSASGGFPNAEEKGDTVSMISTSFWKTTDPPDKQTVVVQCLGKCNNIEGAHIESFSTEKDLLNAWRDLITLGSCPQIMSGYNIFGFDYKYVADRAKFSRASRFWYMGALIAHREELNTKELSSNALGQNEMHILGMRGRCHIDVFHYVKAQYKLQMYSLNAVSEHFLKLNKVDMPYDKLFECLQSNDPDQMAAAAVYCAEDCRLPIRLLKRLEIIASMIEMSRVTHTPIQQLVSRGQQIKVYNQMVWHSHRMGAILNNPPENNSSEGYEGATVIEPTPGFYTVPIATLDFASLYPSIMLAHNLCYSTFVMDEKYKGINGVVYETHKSSETKNYTFTTSTPGILPAILREILGARKKAKKDMANAPNKEIEALLNARQLALKVSANSVYGFTGAVARGMYPCLAIADSVTCCGRQMIQTTRDLVEQFMPCKVIYGDTDSVMVKMPEGMTKEEAFEHGEKAADFISSQFRADVTLEMEKVYQPYLLIAKKRYAGLMYEPNKQGIVSFSKMDAKGIELVRRDNCKWAKTVYKKVLEGLLYEMSEEKCRKYLKEELDKVKNNEVPISDFVLSKQMKKKESYANEAQPHLTVVDKMESRRPGSAPRPGDRVAFYITEGKEDKVSDRAEDPVWGEENGVKPDRLYYLEHQIIKPISVILQPLVENPAELFKECIISLKLQKEKQATLASFFGSGGLKRTKLPEIEEISEKKMKQEEEKEQKQSEQSCSSSTDKDEQSESKSLNMVSMLALPRPTSSISKPKKNVPKRKK